MNKLITILTIITIFSCRTNPKLKENSDNKKIQSIRSEQKINVNKSYLIHHDPIDIQQAQQIELWVDQGQKKIEVFFDKAFEKKFDIHIFSERDSLNKQWQKDWGMPEFQSQCWMVASGIAHRLDILSPRVWKTQACEHDNSDTLETKKLIIHELVHVFHGQNSPSPTFENIEKLDWFVEGLAVYVSGQLDEERFKRANSEILEKGMPVNLAYIWKGRNKYGLAGSVVKFIDEKYGREVLVKLITYTKATEILNTLNISENKLMREWQQSL